MSESFGVFFQGLDFMKFSAYKDANLQILQEPQELMD